MATADLGLIDPNLQGWVMHIPDGPRLRTTAFIFDKAKEALEAVCTTDEVQEIINQTAAIEAYAKQCRDRQMEIDAAIIRHHAERKLGIMLNQHGRQHGQHGQGTDEELPPTIAELGIDKALSARARKVADMSESAFDEAIEEIKNYATDVDTPKYTLSQLDEVHARKRTAPERKAPPGYGSDQFAVITSDPPWEVGGHLPYPSLSDRELIQNYRPPHTQNAWLFLWSTHKIVPRALDVMAGWGAKYHELIVWEKISKSKSGSKGSYQINGLPIYNSEFVLVGKWGNPKTSIFMPYWISAPPTRTHSEKPAEFYEALREVSNGPRLDQFARKQHPGYHAWGDEIGYVKWN